MQSFQCGNNLNTTLQDKTKEEKHITKQQHDTSKRKL